MKLHNDAICQGQPAGSCWTDPTVAVATKMAAWGPQKTQQANDVRRYPAEWSPFRWRWAGQGWMSDWWPKGREEGLQVMQVRHVPWGSGGPPALRSPSPSKEATRPPQDTLCCAPRHTLFPLLRLSLLCSPAKDLLGLECLFWEWNPIQPITMTLLATTAIL